VVLTLTICPCLRRLFGCLPHMGCCVRGSCVGRRWHHRTRRSLHSPREAPIRTGVQPAAVWGQEAPALSQGLVIRLVAVERLEARREVGAKSSEEAGGR